MLLKESPKKLRVFFKSWFCFFYTLPRPLTCHVESDIDPQSCRFVHSIKYRLFLDTGKHFSAENLRTRKESFRDTFPCCYSILLYGKASLRQIPVL